MMSVVRNMHIQASAHLRISRLRVHPLGVFA